MFPKPAPSPLPEQPHCAPPILGSVLRAPGGDLGMRGREKQETPPSSRKLSPVRVVSEWSGGCTEQSGTPRVAQPHSTEVNEYLVSDTHRLSFLLGREDESSASQKLCLDVPQVAWQWHERVSYPSTFPGSLFPSQAQPMILSFSLVRTWMPHHSTSWILLRKNCNFRIFQALLWKIPFAPVKMCWNSASLCFSQSLCTRPAV